MTFLDSMKNQEFVNVYVLSYRYVNSYKLLLYLPNSAIVHKHCYS